MPMNKKLPEEISFGQWLRQRRRILDLTQQDLADQLGCARITLRRIESGALRPSKELAQILLEKFGVTDDVREEWLQFARGRSGYPERSGDSFTGKRLTNLPVSLTSFVGREKERTDVKELLSRNRLVTLTGAGGCGKTRLAMQVATELVNLYIDGVWWVELAALSDPALVIQAVMNAVGLPEMPNRTPIDLVTDYFQSKQALLILDNCEHVVDTCAHLVTRLLQPCRRLTILATSREALNVDGEHAWIIPLLLVPPSDEDSVITNLQFYDSILLFIERAMNVQSDFKLTESNAITVSKICQRLDGIPLAIELAAPRLKTLSLEQISERLDDAM